MTDITYIRTWQGWLYLAVVMDQFSRLIVGWADDSRRARAQCRADGGAAPIYKNREPAISDVA